jgi:IS5 family transposase
MSFSHYDVSRRTARNIFYTHSNTAFNWEPIENEINKHYSSGKSATGQTAYPGILLFKLLLVGFWSGSISDRAVEEMANENLSVMRFLNLRLEDMVPDRSVLSRFRPERVEKDAFDSIMNLINNQLDAHGILVKTGVKIDATITDSPGKPKGKTTYEIAEDRKEDEVSDTEVEKQSTEIKLVKAVQSGVDTEGRPVKKGGKSRLGYKKHICTDEGGLVLW